MKIFGKNKQSGFSLVELMIVVGIIGVLATLALPRFKQFQSKAKMAEAMNVLQHVYTLQQSYSLDNNTFVGFTAKGAGLNAPAGGNQCNFQGDAGAVAIGLAIDPCPANGAGPLPRFSYNATVQGGGSGFIAVARTGAAGNNRVCPGNNAFSIGLNQTNSPSWQAVATDTPATAGAVQVGGVCPQ